MPIADVPIDGQLNGQTAAPLDGQISVVTPENVAFHYEVAGPFRRLPAYLVDLAARAVIFFLVALVVDFAFSAVDFEGLGVSLILLLFFGLSHFYGGLFETFWNGQTPGKRLAGLRVLSVDGRPINALQAILRNILRDVDTMPYALGILWEPLTFFGLYWVGLIAVTLTDRYQRLGDLATGTMVVVERKDWTHGVIQIREPAALDLAQQIPVDFEVTRSLGKTLSMYVERRLALAPLRRAEIARHLAVPLAARFRLPQQTNYDMLLCALYHRTFVSQGGEEFVPVNASEGTLTEAPQIRV